MDAVERQRELPGRLVTGVMRPIWLTTALLLLLLTACVADDPTAATFEAESTLPPVTDATDEEQTTESTASDSTADSESTTSAPPTTEPLPELQGLDAELIADGLDQPVTVAVHGDTIFVTEREGVIKTVDQAGTTTVHADLSDRIGSNSIEQGLLGLAFDGDDLYAYWTDPQGDSVLARFNDGATAFDGDDMDVLLTVDQPAERHNAGHIVIDGDTLYLSLGDGGSGGDTAQDTTNLLGTILRLDLNGNPMPGNHADEIWVYGLRNPWRYSIDDDLMYIGDVGQEAFEEINVVGLTDGEGHQLRLDRNGGRHLLPLRLRPRPLSAAGACSIPMTRAARSPAATSTGARRSPSSPATTSTPTGARAGSAACATIRPPAR